MSPAVQPALQVELTPIVKLVPYARNARTHTDAQVAQIAASIREFGWTNPVLIKDDGTIIAGHGRVLAARQLGQEMVPCIKLGGMSEAQVRAYVIADNKLALNAGWDLDILESELLALQEAGFDLGKTGFMDAELQALLAGALDAEKQQEAAESLRAKFILPPFSVLNARDGWWQERKRLWITLGIESGEGRGVNLLGYSEPAQRGYRQPAAPHSNGIEGEVFSQGCYISPTSIFDPVLCEVVYRWFCPPGGSVLDPFAGGSVRGIVASKLGLPYSGQDLSASQCEANRKQAAAICDEPRPYWKAGDSLELQETWPGLQADLVFSCPPYADLEAYSQDPRDLSNMEYAQFLEAYRKVIAAAAGMLKPDRFAAFCVGEVRDKAGHYRNFVGDTVQAFRDAGLEFYNEAILVTAVGSLPIRVGRIFSAGRKLGKTHQNVLVFCKGSWKKAAEACGAVDVSDALAAIGGSAEDTEQ